MSSEKLNLKNDKLNFQPYKKLIKFLNTKFTDVFEVSMIDDYTDIINTIDEFAPEVEIVDFEKCLEANMLLRSELKNPFAIALLIARLGFSPKSKVKIGDFSMSEVIKMISYVCGSTSRFFALWAPMVLQINANRLSKGLFPIGWTGAKSAGDFFGSQYAGCGPDHLKVKRPDFFTEEKKHIGYGIWLKGAIVSLNLNVKPLVVVDLEELKKIKTFDGRSASILKWYEAKRSAANLSTSDFLAKMDGVASKFDSKQIEKLISESIKRLKAKEEQEDEDDDEDEEDDEKSGAPFKKSEGEIKIKKIMEKAKVKKIGELKGEDFERATELISKYELKSDFIPAKLRFKKE